MKELIISLFGVYTPVMTELPVVLTDSVTGTESIQVYDVVASGVAGVDWPWIMGVLLFAIVLYSLFRVLGVFFK